jgi:Dyp-type peroxidase family
LFVAIREHAAGRAWLSETLPFVTSAAAWQTATSERTAGQEYGLNLALTHSGLSALGLPESALRTFAPEFREGMASENRAHILGDAGESAPERWELGGPNNPPLHVLLIVNVATATSRAAWCDNLRAGIAHYDGLIVEQASSAQLGELPAHGREPFGFADSVGQPRIRGLKGEGVSTGEFILGYQNEYNYYPAGPAVPLADDPQNVLPDQENPFRTGYRDLGFNGSYIVYRKLQQDVASFWRFLQTEAMHHRSAAEPAFMIWLAAKMVGRWPSGVPLVLAPDGDRPEVIHRDDFLYAEADPNGLACPYGAHVRRSNPRDQIRPAGPTESLHMSARHRLLRRGRLFGPPLFDPKVLDHPNEDAARQAIVDLLDDGEVRGIHFLCVNANIKRQFEFVQQAWVNNPRFNGLIDNGDPIAGDNDPAATPPSSMQVPMQPTALRSAPLPRFVTVRGGAYFFMPSLTALRYLTTMG